MARQYFRIVQKFRNADGSWRDGVLDNVVCGQKAVNRQLEANRFWLKAKGHAELSMSVNPTTKP